MHSNRKGPDFALIREMDYVKLKKYIIEELLSEETDSFNREFLTQISKWPQGIYHLDELQTALKHYIELVKIQQKLKNFIKLFNSHSYLEHLYSKQLKWLTDKYFNIELLFRKEAFAQAQHEIKQLHIKLNELEIRAVLPQFKHSQLDHAPRDSRVPANGFTSPALFTAIHLFKNYHETSSIFRLNWRHHCDSARNLERKLKKFIYRAKDPVTLEEAINAILTEMTDIAQKNKMSKTDINQSTFFRRAFYALDLLDKERCHRFSQISTPLSPSDFLQMRRTQFNVMLKEKEQELAKKEQIVKEESAKRFEIFKQKMREIDAKATSTSQYTPQLFKVAQAVDTDRIIRVENTEQSLLKILGMGS